MTGSRGYSGGCCPRIREWSLGEILCSYSRAAELIKAELRKEGLDPALYGIHSLQAGSATTAAALGVPERLFQRQGGWAQQQGTE